MNYYNPYYYMMPTMSSGLGRGLFGGSLRSGINWSSILNGAQRTLNIVNQAIPIVKQAAPMMRNTKTMFKVMNEFKKVDVPSSNSSTGVSSNVTENVNNSVSSENAQVISSGGPTFFV